MLGRETSLVCDIFAVAGDRPGAALGETLHPASHGRAHREDRKKHGHDLHRFHYQGIHSQSRLAILVRNASSVVGASGPKLGQHINPLSSFSLTANYLQIAKKLGPNLSVFPALDYESLLDSFFSGHMGITKPVAGLNCSYGCTL